MYAGSSTTQRGRGDAALLRFEAMRWARDHGCTRFDLGGIAPEPLFPAGQDEDKEPGPGSHLEGVHQFKTGFGGQIVAYPSTVERRYRPVMAWCIRRLYPRISASSDPPTPRESNENSASHLHILWS